MHEGVCRSVVYEIQSCVVYSYYALEMKVGSWSITSIKIFKYNKIYINDNYFRRYVSIDLQTDPHYYIKSDNFSQPPQKQLIKYAELFSSVEWSCRRDIFHAYFPQQLIL